MIIDNKILSVRWYTASDLDQLVSLHQECFPNERWTREDFNAFVSGGHGRNNVLKVLSDRDGRIYGSLLYTLDQATCRVRRVAVSGEYRRQGLATFMIHALCGSRSPIRRKLFVARVPETNTPGVFLFKNKMEFVFDPHKARGIRPDGVEIYEFTYDKSAVTA